jgi:hypothetical protein
LQVAEMPLEPAARVDRAGAGQPEQQVGDLDRAREGMRGGEEEISLARARDTSSPPWAASHTLASVS